MEAPAVERLRWNRGEGLGLGVEESVTDEEEDALSPASKDPDLHGGESQLIEMESRNLLNTGQTIKEESVAQKKDLIEAAREGRAWPPSGVASGAHLGMEESIPGGHAGGARAEEKELAWQWLWQCRGTEF